MKHSGIKASVAALAVAALVGLSACGGGSDGLSRADEEALQAEAAAAEEARKAAEEARQAAEEAKRQAEEAQRQAEEEARQAELEQARAEAAAEEARRQRQEAERAEQERQAEIEEAERRAEEAERQAEEARQEAQRRIEEAEQQADANVRATALIGVLGGTLTEGTGMGVTHMPGQSRTFARPLNLPAKGSAPRVPGSWSSASYSGPRGSVGTDTVYLYTNIQSPSSRAFWKEHGEEVTPLTGAASGFAQTATVASFGTDRSLYRDSDGNAENRDDVSQGGTYDGYSGTFRCATGCNIAADADGALTFTGDWTFTASLTAKRSSRQAEQDSEFLYFGIWAFEPTDPTDTTNPHTFNWARGGASVIPDANFGDLTGEATFSGGAIGKYALAKATGRGARAAKTGTFTATATFTADFDANNLSGRITDFKEGGNDLGSGWNIFLGSSASAPATLAATGVAAGVSSGTIDGDSATGGAWAANLHGSGNEDMSAADDYTVAKYPRADVAGVAGWFNAAAGSDAAIAGAFGAACTTGTMCAK